MDHMRMARGHADPAVLSAQKRRVNEPHVAPLNALAAEISEATRHAVPKFDPTSGGIHARALLLLESPGPASTANTGSNIISPHNNDPTAEHIHILLRRNHIPFNRILLWNVVPWWLPAQAGKGRFRAPRTADIEDAALWLDRLLELLPRLETVMTLGRRAEAGLDRYRRRDRPFPYTTIAAPHPGNRAWNRPELRTGTEAAFASLAGLLLDVAGGAHPDPINHWSPTHL